MMGSLPVVVDCFCLLRWQGQAPSIAGLTNISSGRDYIIIAAPVVVVWTDLCWAAGGQSLEKTSPAT